MDVIDTLEQRGFLQQTTDRDALKRHLAAGPRTIYLGVDPSGASLHVGHLMPVMALWWLQQAGHKVILVLGGGTGMVGDPSGKDKTRSLITPEQVAQNLESVRPQFGQFLDPAQTDLVDNGTWLLGLNYIDFLRDIGRHFSVNRMLSAEGARQRLERNQGLSFIEFNYHLLQSYDFLYLFEKQGCTLQIGGDDQWFNILGGADLIRRVHSAEAHALTVPLIMTASGKKMGKTESGAVWLSADMLAPYDYYQYWLNVEDADVERFLKFYTRLDLVTIAQLAALEGKEIRRAKQRLAWEATALAHGPDAADAARDAAKAAFSGGVSADMPTVHVSFPVPLLDVMVEAGLCKSKGEARRLIRGGGARIDDTKIGDEAADVVAPCVVWAGKKRAVRVEATG